MSLIDFSCLCIFLVFAHLSESRVLILRDYDDVPFVLDHVDRSIAKEIEPQHEAISISSHYRPKKMRSTKKTILQYGRHIYHLDDFQDLKELRSKISEYKNPSKDGSIAYDYVDIKDWRSINSAKDGVGEYTKDLLILSETPLHICNGEDCGDPKAFRKFDDHKDWRHEKNRLRFLKRFQIVDNRHKGRTRKPKHSKYDLSEEYNHKKKKSIKKHKKKKQIDSPEFMDSNSEQQSSESWGSKKKKKYSSEESIELKRKPKKKKIVDDSTSASKDDWKDESDSIENTTKIKKKKKKKNYGTSSEIERKSIGIEDEDDYFMQGNKVYHSKDKKNKKSYEDDGRKRLGHFMPKRYHWEPEEIHDLGYFWFNGPKGAYPEPRPL